MNKEQICDRIAAIREQLPADVRLEAAAKTRTPEEVKTAIDAGIDFIGYNYVQEGLQIAEDLRTEFGTDFSDRVQYNLIGHLQKNKINKALSLYRMIETVDSPKKAEEISKRARSDVDILIQVNIGCEESKQGSAESIIPEVAETAASLDHIHLRGLMTIEPYNEDPEDSRNFFRKMREHFDRLKSDFGSQITYLSMGMSHSWKTAVEEGATVIRIGTGLFGPRN